MSEFVNIVSDESKPPIFLDIEGITALSFYDSAERRITFYNKEGRVKSLDCVESGIDLQAVLDMLNASRGGLPLVHFPANLDGVRMNGSHIDVFAAPESIAYISFGDDKGSYNHAMIAGVEGVGKVFRHNIAPEKVREIRDAAMHACAENAFLKFSSAEHDIALGLPFAEEMYIKPESVIAASTVGYEKDGTPQCTTELFFRHAGHAYLQTDDVTAARAFFNAIDAAAVEFFPAVETGKGELRVKMLDVASLEVDSFNSDDGPDTPGIIVRFKGVLKEEALTFSERDYVIEVFSSESLRDDAVKKLSRRAFPAPALPPVIPDLPKKPFPGKPAAP